MLRLCHFLSNFISANSCIIEISLLHETACSRLIQYLSVHVSPDLLSLYLQSHIIYTAYSSRMAHTITRTLLSLFFRGTNIYCCAILDSPIRHLMNDAYYRLQVRYSLWDILRNYVAVNKQIDSSRHSFRMECAKHILHNCFLQKIIHFYINLLYVLILFLLVFFY